MFGLIGKACVTLAHAVVGDQRVDATLSEAGQVRFADEDFEPAAEAFAHALSLSLDFHQTKRSGALSRTMDRGSRAVDFLLRILALT